MDEIEEAKPSDGIKLNGYVHPYRLASANDRQVVALYCLTFGVANDRLNIRMTGKALSDGALHQRIRVENSSSGRVVEGIVRSRELPHPHDLLAR